MEQPRSSSLATRAILALFLMAGFYVLAAAMIALLAFVIYLQLAGRFLNVYLLLVSFFGIGVIIWSIVPRIDKFLPPGPRLQPEEHPRLFAELNSVSKAVGQAMPSEVYLLTEVNAFVTQRGGFMGVGSRRVMGIGLPLLRTLTVPQLRAVVVHEFGHFYGGDTKLGPVVYKTRGAVIRTLTGLSGHSILQAPFRGYAVMYLRVSQAVSRGQEYSADRLAAKVAGAGNMQKALLNIHGAAPAWEAYMNSEITPIFRHGFVPPLSEGFKRFTQAKGVAEKVTSILEKDKGESKTSPYDSHPSLRDRLKALEVTGTAAEAADEPAAISLIDNVAKLELKLLEPVAKRYNIKDLKSISWEEAVEKIYIPGWRALVQQQKSLLSGIKPESLAEEARRPGRLMGRLLGAESLSEEQRQNLMEQTIGAAITLAMVEKGWKVNTSPGETVTLQREGKSIQAFELFPRLMAGTLPREDWLNTCKGIGIEGVELGGVTGIKMAQ